MVTRQRRLTPDERARIRFWDEGAVTHPWIELLLKRITEYHVNPVRASRAMALVTVAMYDATVASWDAKFAYGVQPPARRNPAIEPLVSTPDVPSFPSEHAAVAEAAATVLSYLFREEEDDFRRRAREAGESRIAAGVSTPSDVAAGRAIGAAVGALVAKRGREDNARLEFTAAVPVGTGFWAPAWPWNLLEPAAGTWQPWVLPSGDAVAIAPPPLFGSPQYLAEADEVMQIVANLAPEQRKIAAFWADGARTATPGGHWMRDASAVVDERFRQDAPHATRTLALLGVTIADAFIACWNAKYTFWTARPDHLLDTAPFRDELYVPYYWLYGIARAIQDRGPGGYVPLIRTPPFPGYPSGHATQSGAASEMLAYLFPDLADTFRARAEEAALSRLYGGIHFTSDNVQGLVYGREVGRRAVEYARGDGSAASENAPARAAR